MPTSPSTPTWLTTLLLPLLLSPPPTTATPPPDPSLPMHAPPNCLTGPLSPHPICNTSTHLTPLTRAKSLISLLTLPEKLPLLGNVSPGVPRLGLPPYHWWNEALHGVALSPGVSFLSPNVSDGEWSHATAFPQPYSMAASFDDELFRKMAGVVGTEARAFANAGRAGRNWWSPTLNLFRDPRWGRGQESPGEDVLIDTSFHGANESRLGKRYAREFVAGLSYGTGEVESGRLMNMATCKHVAAYDLEDWHGVVRYGFDAKVETRDLAEYYMQPFQECVRESKVSAIMCSYNAVNGVPACADPYLLQDVVRDHWGWGELEGTYVVSDCGAVRYGYSDQHYTGTREEMVAESLKSGVDLDCGYYYPDYMGAALENGLVTEADIDQALVRMYTGLVQTGFFDSDDPYQEIGWQDVATPEATALALRAAEEGVVLLKNDGVLPLKVPKNGKKLKLAVFGSWANATVEMQGNYQGVAESIKSPIQAFEDLESVEVVTADWQRSKFEFVKSEQPDVIITIDGNRLEDAKETRDRDLLQWHGDFSDIVFSLTGLGIPIIVVNLGEQADNGPYLRDDGVSAVLWGGYGGQAGGEALANIITGKAAPSGRLPVTQYPLEYVYQIDMTDMALRPDPKTGRPGRTYRFFDNATFPFGFGLHYTSFSTALDKPSKTTFSISDLVAECDPDKHLDQCAFSPDANGLGITARVTNTGGVASDFVLLAFIAGEFGEEPFPFKTLVDYTRVQDLQGGKEKEVGLSLTLGGLARHDTKGNQILYPGKYRLLLDEPSQVVWEFELVGEEVVLDVWPQPRSGKKDGQASHWKGNKATEYAHSKIADALGWTGHGGEL